MSTIKTKKNEKILIKDIIKELQYSLRLSVAELADMIGIKFYTLRSYESGEKIPPLKNMILLANFFGISLDYLNLRDKTPYIHSTRLVSLTAQIDRLDSTKRYQVENNVNTLIGKNQTANIANILDRKNIGLTEDIHKNISLLRKEKNLTQQKMAEYLNITQPQAYRYEKDCIPPADNLIILSAMMDVSIHYLATGQRLDYDIRDDYLKETILKADKLLSLEDKKFLCKLMENIIEQTKGEV